MIGLRTGPCSSPRGSPYPGEAYHGGGLTFAQRQSGTRLAVGLIGPLWKRGVLERVGPVWTTIGIVIAIGLGVMVSVSGSGNKETVEIDQKR